MKTDSQRPWYDLMRRLGRRPEPRMLSSEDLWAEYSAAPHQPAPATLQDDAHRDVPSASKASPALVGCSFDPTQSMELVWQSQQGNANAVNELFTRYLPRLRRILAIKISTAQRAAVDPEDVLQETLIVAARRLNELKVRTPASILQWLSKIADYEIKNRLEYLHAERRDPARERRMRPDCESKDEVGVEVPSEDPTPSQSFARSEIDELIDLHVRQLEPADYREVILLRDYYEADWERIRSILGRPSLEAVKDLYVRARKRLRERIAKYLD